MSDFFKKFLLEDPRRFSASGRFVALGAFGKHPGWDDHVEDLGLETEGLNFAKTTLYVNGIGGQIDAGAWEKLEPGQQLAGFRHLFVWQRSGQVLIGRMWSSSDGKGRKRYPMVVCLHFMGLPLGWALRQALPVLAELEQGCASTSSAADVRSLLARKRAALREAVQSTDGKGEYAPVAPEALHAILGPAGETKPEGFLRVLYQIESQLAGFAPGIFNVRTHPTSVRVQQIRVPMAAANPEQALLFWTRFFLVYVDHSVPLLLALPLEADWIDATLGEPESHEMFCLRATPKAVPKVSEVPYKLEDEFRSKGTAFLQSFQRGETARPDLKVAAAPASVAAAPRKGGWLRWLGVGSILIFAAAAAFFLLSKKDEQPLTANPAAARPETSNATASAQKSPSIAGGPDVGKATANGKSESDEAAEKARLAQTKKNAEAVMAAARLKAETEAAAKENERQVAEAAAKEKESQLAEAAAKEKERLLAVSAAKEKERLVAEAARLEAEKQAPSRQELQEDQRKAAQVPALTPPVEQTAARIESASASTSAVSAASPATGAPPGAAVATNEMTNSIGMVLVRLPSGFWVGKYEVTQGEYRQIMKSNPSNAKWLNDRQPVEQITWNDAVDFTRKLTEQERASLPAATVYSLPTERQWKEFAAGQKFEDLPNGSAIRKEPSLVGQSGPANSFGLFDVLGNLWEWCLDDAPGDQKLLKGGAFNSNNYDRTLRPDAKSLSCGFRCILAPAENH